MSTNYEQFIAANAALIECMKAVPVDDFKAMSATEQAGVCSAEAFTVKKHIEAGHASIGSILQERLAIVQSAKE